MSLKTIGITLEKPDKKAYNCPMEIQDSFVLVQKKVTSDKYYIDACILEESCVICVNRENKKNKLMPFKILYDNNNLFWLQNDTWEYFFSLDECAKIEERIIKFTAQWEKPDIKEASPAMPETASDAVDGGYGKEYKTIATMTENERVLHIREGKDRLDTLIAQNSRQDDVITEALVETARDAMLHNHAALMNTLNLSSDDAKKQTQDLVDSTRDLVKASTQLISENIVNDELMNILVSKSNGSIIQHMTQVYLKGLAFLSYYNKLVSGSSVINKIRISFEEKYKAFYRPLLPHIHEDDITLERVFLGGMRAISDNNFHDWAVGFLLHDIGKAGAVEYHEGESSYNQEIVREHVNIGYTAVMNKTNYPRDAGLITGYHHEYYGDPSGYGLFRSALEQYKKINPHINPNYCISYDIEPLISCEALAFFPAKFLEIIDVFDALTDPNRKYREALSAKNALDMMREEFIEKHCKLDIILFDLYTKFIEDSSSF